MRSGGGSVPDEDKTTGAKISAFGMSLENVPRSVVAVVAVVITLLLVATVWWTKVREPARQIVTLQEANASLMSEVEEYNRHIGEPVESTATLMDDVRGKLVTQRYNDGCVLIIRSSKGSLKSKLIVDLAKDMHGPATASITLPTLVPVVEAAGRCLNPHPGNFVWSYGKKTGCWIEVWRKWADGCTHVQMLDTCDGSWDPKINWTQCVH